MQVAFQSEATRHSRSQRNHKSGGKKQSTTLQKPQEKSFLLIVHINLFPKGIQENSCGDHRDKKGDEQSFEKLFAKPRESCFFQQVLLIFHKDQSINDSKSCHQQTHINKTLILKGGIDLESFASAERLNNGGWPIKGKKHQNDRDQHNIGGNDKDISSIKLSGHQQTKLKQSQLSHSVVINNGGKAKHKPKKNLVERMHAEDHSGINYECLEGKPTTVHYYLLSLTANSCPIYESYNEFNQDQTQHGVTTWAPIFSIACPLQHFHS